MLRALDFDDTHLVDLTIEDRERPDPLRVMRIETKGAKAAAPELKATAMTVGDERPEIMWVTVDGVKLG